MVGLGSKWGIRRDRCQDPQGVWDLNGDWKGLRLSPQGVWDLDWGSGGIAAQQPRIVDHVRSDPSRRACADWITEALMESRLPYCPLPCVRAGSGRRWVDPEGWDPAGGGWIPRDGIRQAVGGSRRMGSGRRWVDPASVTRRWNGWALECGGSRITCHVTRAHPTSLS